MAIWKHTVCGESVDDPGEPVVCPRKTIPECNNPTLGFDAIRSNVWKCKSCDWLFVGEASPTECPSVNAQPCSNIGGGTFQKVCD